MMVKITDQILVPVVLLISLFALAIAPSPGNAQSGVLKQYSQALQKESEGDYLSAIFIYQDILKENRFFIDAKIGLARCYFETGNLTLSENTLKDALKQEKGNIDAINLLGRVYTSMKRYEEAEQQFNLALKIDHTGYEARYRLADLYRARGDYKRAVELYNELLKIYPQEAKTYIYLGIVYTEMGEIEKAGGFFRKAVSLDSHNPLTHLNLANHYYKMGVKYSLNAPADSDEYFNAALTEANTALTIEMNLPAAYEILSNVHFFRKNYGEAIPIYLKRLENSKNEYILLYELGFCYEMLEDREKAIDAYSRALLKRFDDEVIRFRLENLLLELYRTNLSNPQRIEYSNYQFSKGKFNLERNFFDKAYLHLKRAIMLDPLNAGKRLELAELFRMRKYYEQYLFELKNIIHDTLDVNTVDINDRIEIYKNRVDKNLASRWRVDQYEERETPRSFPKTRARVAVLDAFKSDYIREDFVHRRFSKTFAEMLGLTLTYHPKIEVVMGKEEVYSEKDALRQAQTLKADYYITGSIEERPDSLKVQARLLSGFNGVVKKEFITYYTGNDRILNTVVSLASQINQRIPLRGMIVRLEGNRALINLGRGHGVEKGMSFLIIQEGRLKINPETGEFEVDPEISLGELTITEVDEMISEGTYTIAGTYNRVNVYDSVVLREKELEDNKK